MSDKRLICNLALAASIVISSVSFGIAQKPAKTPPTEDPSQKDRKVKTEESKKKIYTDWVSKDVAYIITPDEIKAYKKLTTDEERENFIENFWRRRDPDPDTEENEYRDEYFERIAYANENLRQVFRVGKLIGDEFTSLSENRIQLNHIHRVEIMIAQVMKAAVQQQHILLKLVLQTS